MLTVNMYFQCFMIYSLQLIYKLFLLQAMIDDFLEGQDLYIRVKKEWQEQETP